MSGRLEKVWGTDTIAPAWGPDTGAVRRRAPAPGTGCQRPPRGSGLGDFSPEPGTSRPATTQAPEHDWRMQELPDPGATFNRTPDIGEALQLKAGALLRIAGSV